MMRDYEPNPTDVITLEPAFAAPQTCACVSQPNPFAEPSPTTESVCPDCLARHPQALSLPAPPKAILLTADHVPHAIKTAVEAAWGCPVYNHYGMTEMGLGGGGECAARRGYHLREADLYVEIVDPPAASRWPRAKAARWSSLPSPGAGCR